MRPSSAGGNTLSSGSRSARASASGSGVSSGSLHMLVMSSLPALVVSRMMVFLKSM